METLNKEERSHNNIFFGYKAKKEGKRNNNRKEKKT